MLRRGRGRPLRILPGFAASGGQVFGQVSRLLEAEEDNSRDHQPEGEDGKDMVEHGYFFRLTLVVAQVSRATRTPTQRLRMLGTHRPT